jgi:hypothetical protein
MIAITPRRNTTKSAPSVGKVPGETTALFFAASDPAIARIGIAWAKRPRNIAIPVVTLYQGVLALSPAKASNRSVR